MPKPEPRSRRAKSADQLPQLTRAEQRKARGVKPQMPPNPAPYIIERLIEIGLTEAAGMGVGPLSWTTIAAWQAVTGVTVSPWEAKLIRRLSIAYLAEHRLAEDEARPAPWRGEVTVSERDAEDRDLRALLG